MKDSLKYLNALRTFEAAARHESFAEAARELDVSQSVISHHVSNLESLFKLRFFERRGNRVQLTADGARLSPKIAMGLQIIRESCDDLQRHVRPESITIYAEPAISARWLRRQITRFSAEHKNIEIQLRPTSQIPDSIQSANDLVVHFQDEIAKHSFRSRRLFPVDGFPACAPELLSQVSHESGKADFSALPILHDNGYYVWQKWFAAYAPNDDSWKSGRLYSDFSLSIDAAVDGEGVFLADAIICARELKAGQLVKIDDREVRCTWYSVSIAKNQRPCTAAEKFQKWLIKSAEDFLT